MADFWLRWVFIGELKMTDSQQLLATYVKTGSEAAFRELLACYIDLVYSTALRLVQGDTHQAEDVAQTVFTDLAREAHTLSADTMLGGWLHRDTCFVASKLMRAERRRQHWPLPQRPLDRLNDPLRDRQVHRRAHGAVAVRRRHPRDQWMGEPRRLIRLGFDDDAQRFLVTLEVGREDLDAGAGRLQAKELVVQLSRVYSRSVVRRWVAVGIVSGLLLVLIGVGLGVELGRWLR